MPVHEQIAAPPTANMDATDNGSAPTGVYDPERIVGLLDAMADGDFDATAHVLEELARKLRKAARARTALLRVPATSLRAGMALRTSHRKGTELCP